MLFKLNSKHINMLKRHKCVRRTMRVPFSVRWNYMLRPQNSLIRIVVLFSVGVVCVMKWCGMVVVRFSRLWAKEHYLLTFLCFDNVMNTKCIFSVLRSCEITTNEKFLLNQILRRELCMYNKLLCTYLFMTNIQAEYSN